MTKDEATLMFNILSSDMPKFKEELKDKNLDGFGGLGTIFSRRLLAHGVRIRLDAAVFVLVLIDTPGDSTLWVWTLFNIQRDADHIITLDDFVEAFPMGVPALDSYRAAWAAQKKNYENMLDQTETWVR